jgi:hypothetical protein
VYEYLIKDVVVHYNRRVQRHNEHLKLKVAEQKKRGEEKSEKDDFEKDGKEEVFFPPCMVTSPEEDDMKDAPVAHGSSVDEEKAVAEKMPESLVRGSNDEKRLGEHDVLNSKTHVHRPYLQYPSFTFNVHYDLLLNSFAFFFFLIYLYIYVGFFLFRRGAWCRCDGCRAYKRDPCVLDDNESYQSGVYLTAGAYRLSVPQYW